MTLNKIKEEKFQTAAQFLDELRITNNRWISKQDNWTPSWIFRGQPDSTQQLIPHAWRSKYLERYKSKYKPQFEELHSKFLNELLQEIRTRFDMQSITDDEARTESEMLTAKRNRELALSLQFFVEMMAVKEFTEFADKLGYPVPGADKFIVPYENNIHHLPEEKFLINQFWRFSNLHPPFNVECSAVALAQHHGIPTRLLDWTEEPLFAAFFAAESFTANISQKKRIGWKSQRIAVWAISKEVFAGTRFASRSANPIKLIAVPRNEIGYLLAQKGIFTHDQAANDEFRKTGRWRSVEEALKNDPRFLQKLSLPVSQVEELLRLLWLEGISRAHLMPTYDNIMLALQSRGFWETLQH